MSEQSQIAIKAATPVAEFSRFMEKMKGQMSLALPKHLNADRMSRLALTSFSTTPALQRCTYQSIAGAIMTAAQLGLEPGINGQGYLIPYKETCTFVPGWKGLVDICNRAGRASVWTGAVFAGDDFDYALGDNPFIKHRPGDQDGEEYLTHVYAVGRVNGSQYPVIEVWTVNKIIRHRDKYNKVGGKHYSFKDFEMYARKVPLLQVLKYMPSSIELTNALAVANASEEGRGATIEGNFVTISDADPRDDEIRNAAPVAAAPQPRSRSEAVSSAVESLKRQTPPSDIFPAGSASAAADQSTGELGTVTPSQIKFLTTKAASMDLPESALQAMLTRLGASSLETMTFTQFDAARAELLAME